MLFLWLQWIILFAVFFDKNYSCVVGMEPGKKRWAERAFSNLFKFYNQKAIIWQSHKLSTFSSHPPWGPTFLNSRIKKGTEIFTTNPLNAANPRKKGREARRDREPGRTEENRGGSPKVLTSGSSPLHWVGDITEASFTKLLPGPYLLDILIWEGSSGISMPSNSPSDSNIHWPK